MHIASNKVPCSTNKKGRQRNEIAEKQVMHGTIAHHPVADAQSVPEQ